MSEITDESEWLQDLINIRSAGMDTLRVGEFAWTEFGSSTTGNLPFMLMHCKSRPGIISRSPAMIGRS